MPIKVTATIVGNALNGFPRALSELPLDTRRRLKVDVEQAAREMAVDARRRAPVSTGGRASRKAKNRPGPGELRDTIRMEPSRTDAPVAYVVAGTGKFRRRSKAITAKGKRRAKALRASAQSAPALGAYAMAVEYGSPHRGIAAGPYMRPAREAAAPKFQQRIEAALSQVVRTADQKASAGSEG